MSPSEEQFVDVGRGIELCYETFGSPGDPPLLLVMALGMQLIAWPDDFCALLAGEGFHVVRFDNRDAGLSTSVKAPPPGLPQLATRRFGAGQYTLEDMADDAAGLLAALDLVPAHVVGASLGGMIAQTLAARHPGSVRTLTSIMSTTGSRVKGQPQMGMLRILLQRAPEGRDAFVEHFAKVFELIGSPDFPKDIEEMRDQAGRTYDRGVNPAGTGRQLAAILKSGDRTKALKAIVAPTLVIHGSKDRLVRPSGGKATAAAIPGAELMLIEGMGHDLPRAVWPRIVAAVAERGRRHDGALQTA
ncbi:MAG: alpha/beta fold hydrolase [Thermoleophilaceae bacterium]